MVNKFIIFFITTVFIALFISSCKKEKIEIEVPLYDSIYDMDSNVYQTVKIGNQWWMAENLKTKKYNNGENIRQAQGDAFWIQQKPAYCKYNENANDLLYNWYAVTDTNGLAPKGWHVATDNDYKLLEIHLGLTQAQADSISWRGTNQGEKLKAKGLVSWRKYEDVWNTNSSGFNATAGSCRLPNATFGSPGLFSTGFWWCATEAIANNKAYYRHLDYKTKNILRHSENKNYGMSVRCVKD